MASDDFLNNILENWGEQCDNSSDSDNIEAYIYKYPEKCFTVDIFPYVIQNAEKENQVSVFYKRFLDGEIEKREFLHHEDKFINLMRIMWLYNCTDIWFNLYTRHYFRKGISCYNLKLKNKDSKVWMDIKDLKNFQDIVRLALREAGALWVYFREWQILAQIQGFCIMMLTKDEKIKDKIAPILTTCSLFFLSN